LTSTVDPFNLPQRTASNDKEIDREALARLLIEIARNVDPDYRAQFETVPTADPRMEQLRQLLVSREISELSRVTQLLDEPEQLAAAAWPARPRQTDRRRRRRARASLESGLSSVFPLVEGGTA